MTRDIPGDIAEVGVLRGAGMLTWLRFLELSGDTTTRVVGFDWYDTAAMFRALPPKDRAAMKTIFKKPYPTRAGVDKLLAQYSGRYRIIDGNIAQTAPRWRDDHPGGKWRILYLDVDCSGPSYAAISALFDMVSPGGIICFDDYGAQKWSEAAGINRFLDERGIPYPVPGIYTQPRAWMVK